MCIRDRLHDVCKAQYYKTSMRNVKNEETGAWEKKPVFVVEDSFPYGHGEKSVFLIERFMRLKTSEAMEMCIRDSPSTVPFSMAVCGLWVVNGPTKIGMLL